MVVLVNEEDRFLGVMDKMAAHRTGRLHRAFSVFLFNPRGELLIQQRAKEKYHSGGLWTNTCCSHPQPGEKVEKAAHRRLKEELGMDASVRSLFTFIYKAEFSDGLTEHELDHVLIGITNDMPVINREEVEAYRFLSREEIIEELRGNPWDFTAWFQIIMEQYGERLWLEYKWLTV